MLRGRRISVWRSRYELSVDGRPFTVWDGATWRTGGSFELAGRQYRVRSNMWGNEYGMVDADDVLVASADRVGRKRWTVRAGGESYEFQRASWFGSEQELLVGGVPAGRVKRTGIWRGEIEADLPGLPLPVQVFAVGVIISLWDRQNAAAGA